MSDTVLTATLDVQAVETAAPVEVLVEHNTQPATLLDVVAEQIVTVEAVISAVEHVDVPVTVVTVAEQGPRGIQGPPGASGAAYLTLTADTALSGHRIVSAVGAGRAGYADSASAATAMTALGITMGAADADAPVNIQFSGEMDEPSWNWDIALPVYLGANGALTQSLPASGVVMVIGVPISPTSLVISFKPPIISI